MSENKFTLAIETAVCGGSLSLRSGATESDGWVGASEISKSQDVLEEIAGVLERSGAEKKSIERIVVSRGPGSYTGIRIGMAIGLGLKKSLGCVLDAAAILPAMAAVLLEKESTGGEIIIAAVPLGRDQICWQSFSGGKRETAPLGNQPRFSSVVEFFDSHKSVGARRTKIILHHRLYREFRENHRGRLTENIILTDAGENIARLIARAARPPAAGRCFRPIYVKDD